mmetsp:Transcript_18503/g.52351  ORF Transcript_18503/g.52351 Transcript_18503/m.52351 type:complete len:291 (+) Transcript_18503:131-1003(+)
MLRAALAAFAAAVASGPGAHAITKELYTTNSVCRQRYCVNPAFPALTEIPRLEGLKWFKRNRSAISPWMEFCGSMVDYDPAVPEAANVSRLARYMQAMEDKRQGLPVLDDALPVLQPVLREAVAQHDKEALKMYFYHLAGMGIEPWDHTVPARVSHNPTRPCARSVARMVCFTFFPQALPTLLEGQEVPYLRPCRNSCENYLEACGVECCDDGVTCVWDALRPRDDAETTAVNTAKRTQGLGGREVLLQTGYIDAAGPCLQCTGGSPAGAGAAAALVLLVLQLWAYEAAP